MCIATDVKKIFSDTVYGIMNSRDDIVLVDVDLMRITGTGLIRESFPDKYVQAGIAEQNGLNIASGFAAMGKVALMPEFAGFLTSRASDQVLNTVCYNELDVKMFGCYAGMTSGINGGTHISIMDLAVMRSMPGMKVADPGDGDELASMIRVAIETPGPTYVRIPKGPMNSLHSVDGVFQWGKGKCLNEGGIVALITTGIATEEGILAVQMLKEKGIDVMHVHMPSIKPIDDELIQKCCEECHTIVTAENHSVIGGLGSAVCESVTDRIPRKVIRLGVQDEFCEGATIEFLKERHGISARRIAETIEHIMK